MPASSQSHAIENSKTNELTTEREKPDQDRDREAIEKLAYALWEKRGCPAGTAEADWFEAERKLSEHSAAATANG
jgi:hypothetical protein